MPRNAARRMDRLVSSLRGVGWLHEKEMVLTYDIGYVASVCADHRVPVSNSWLAWECPGFEVKISCGRVDQIKLVSW